MLEFLTRRRSPGSLFATMFVAMVVGLVVALFCLVKILQLALRG